LAAFRATEGIARQNPKDPSSKERLYLGGLFSWNGLISDEEAKRFLREHRVLEESGEESSE
jgi:hypothetical protein